MADVVQKVHILADMDISQAKGQVASLEAAFKKLAMPKNMENNFNKVFSKMKSDLSQVEALMQKGLTSKSDVTSFNKLTDSVSTGYSKIITMVNQLNGQKVTMKVDTAQLDKLKQRLTELQQNYNNALKGITTGTGKDSFGGMLSNIEKIASSSKLAKAGLESIKGSIKAGDFTAADASLEKFVNNLTRLGSAKKNQIAGELGIEAAEALSKVRTKWSTAQNDQFRDQVLAKLQTGLTAAATSANTLETEMNEVAASMNKIQTGNLDKVKTTLQELGSSAEKYSQQQQKMNQQSQQGVMYQYNKQMQVNDLRMQVQYFFGLQNMIRLFRRGVQDAINTVKELDKAMTATAVVTDFSVGDMWGQLPEYTKRAQQLGTTIADMYNATTLYYQQGLDTEHAMGTAVETLKMARIAGIEGAEATDLMTAALRGFRMESNEANASHVNDVYSALAAHSASNTYEIGTAMSKVASLASSANMDLETTATFLAQIIETTREAPETAGTALKTIIARFGEVKKLAKDGLLTGADEEGEAIDINKVDTALKTAGISLQDFINGNEGLDQVFLRLSEKWDTLSVAQQRYIATQAAGARMQARFIAMMQDYGRTQELLGIATNAEGAGDKQFAKTTESLEYKLNKLKDAYHSFIMGIANSSAIKAGVDILTKGFDLANKAIQKVSNAVKHLNSTLGSVVQTALSLGTAFAALKIGGKLLNTGVNFLGGLMLGRGAMATARQGGGIFGGVTGARTAAITRPIVAKLDTLIAAVKIGNKNTANLAALEGSTQDRGISLAGRQFLSARNNFRNAAANGFTVSGLKANFLNNYDSETQRAIMNSTPGISQAIKGSYLKAAENSGLKDAALLSAKSFVHEGANAFKTGRISFDTYTKAAAMATTKSFAQPMQAAGAQVAKLMANGMSEDQAYQQIIQSNVAKAEQQVTEQWRQSLSGNMATAPKEMQDKYIAKQISKHPDTFKAAVQTTAFGENKEIKTTGIQKLGDSFASVGAGIASAGMSLNMFSMQLSSMGADKAAAAVSGLGSALTAVGMAATGVGGIISSLFDAETGALKSGGVIGLGIAAVATTALLTYKAYKEHIDNIRKEGKNVTKDYQKNVLDQRKSLKDLTDSYSEYEKLRQGVDARGNNLTLSDEDYQRYQDYTDKLIKMNGALQQGVNDSGEAYISQSADIKKALREETKEAELANQKYLSNTEGQKILNQINTYKRLQGLYTGEVEKRNRSKNRADLFGAEDTEKKVGKFTTQAESIQKTIEQLGLTKQQLKDLNLDDIKWENIGALDAKKISDSASALTSLVEASTTMTDVDKKYALKGIDKFSGTYKDAIEASADMNTWVDAYLKSINMDATSIEKTLTDKITFKSSNAHFAQIGKEQAASLAGGFQEGLQTLTLQGQMEGWSPEQFKKEAAKYAKTFTDLTDSTTSKYSDALAGIAAAQEEFDSKISEGRPLEKAANKYKADISNEILELNSLAQKYESSTDIGADAIAENIRNAMQKAILYTSEGNERIQENLNDLSKSFGSANSALENYQEQTKDLKDYYTAAEGMKTILADVGWDKEKKTFTGQDVEGHGSQKFWLAAENIVDERVLNSGVDKVKAKISEIVPMLEEGEKGYKNFMGSLHSHYKNQDIPGLEKFYSEYMENGKKKFKLEVDDSNLGEMANLLGMSDNLLSSLVNKSRQFMDWNPSNISGLISSLRVSDQTIKNADDTFFYNFDQFKSEARTAGVGMEGGKNSEFNRVLQSVIKQGGKFFNIDALKANDKTQIAYAKEYLKYQNVIAENGKVSIDELRKAITPLAESGQYSAADALAILQKGKAITDDKGIEDFSRIWEEINASPDLKATNEIADNTAQANNYLAQLVASSGEMPDGLEESIKANKKEIYGEKGNDTDIQKAGNEGKNKNNTPLTFNERRDWLTYTDTKKQELEQQEKTLQTIIDAKNKEGADTSYETEQLKLVQAMRKSLEGYETRGLSGTTTAETLLGGFASEFDFSKFTTRADLMGLGWVDSQLGTLKDVNVNTVGKILQQAVEKQGLSSGAANSIMGQYGSRLLQEKGIQIADADVDKIGAVLNQSNTESFEKALKLSGFSGDEKTVAALREIFEGSHKEESESKTEKKQEPESKTGKKQESESESKPKQTYESEPDTRPGAGLAKEYGGQEFFAQHLFDRDNSLITKNFSGLLQTVKQNGATEKTQSTIMGNYLQNNAQTLMDQQATNKEIHTSINRAAQVMQANGMSTEAIAAAINKGYGTNVNSSQIQTDENGKVTVDLDESKLTEQLQNLEATANVTVQSINLAATGQNNHRFGTFARGSRHGYTIPGRPTLTGEEGEELVWEPKRNQAYMVGTNGPQFANISRDAVVWNAAQTRKIKKNSGSAYFGTGAKGIRNFGTMGLGSLFGGGGGGGKHINGTLEIDATANITDVNDPPQKHEIPVTARIEGTTEGGIGNFIKSLVGKQTTTTIPVTANVTDVDPPKRKVPVEAVAKVANVTKAGTVSGEPVKVDAVANVKTAVKTGNAAGAVQKVAKTAGGTQTMTVGANPSPALAVLSALISTILTPRVIPVSLSASRLSVVITPSFQGTWEKTVKIHKEPATGMNYKKYNSYAKGKSYAQNSNGKGGLALTGEEGYEVVWLPKQGQSMIVGMEGPQMMNLPSDAVVWPHDQSKKILKNNKGIMVGSFGFGTDYVVEGGSSSKKTTTKKSSSGGSKAAAQTAKNTTAIKQGVGRINAMDVGIYNLTKKIEITNAKIEKNSETIKDKLDKTIDFSYSQISGTVGTQSKTLTELKKQNDELNKQYKTRLKQLETGTNIYEKYSITYQKKTDAKGTEKSDTFQTTLGTFITKAANGALQVNYKAIDAIAKDPRKGKKMADAILTAVKKEIDDMTSKQISAEKAARDAAKKLQDLREQLKETLFAWENELKKIKILEDKLSLGDSYSKVTEGLRGLIEKTVNPSLSNLTQLASQYQRAINSSIITMKNQISAQLDLRNAYQEQLKSDLTTSDEVANYNKATNAYNNAKKAKKSQGEIEKLYAAMLQAKDELDGARVGKRLVSTKMDEYGQIYVDFDWETLESERQKGNVNKTEYEATKKYYEKITNTVEKINDSNNELANKLGSLYEERNDQYQMMSDYTQKIREGMEDEEQKTIDNLKDLNDSIRDAFKDLIDKVKRELDRQRELEKNEKTEQDISDQMNRLAMLRADTAGSNAAEIARLEKEITDATGDYEDSLEDQLLDRLEDQAEEAADQREKQIELLTAQLEYSQTAGLYLAKAENLVEKIASGKATSEEMKLAQLYYLSSDKLLDKWGKQLEAINFGADTLKVEGFNEAVKAFEAAIGEFNKITETSQGIVQDFINGVLEPSDATQDSYTSRDVKGLKKDITDARKTGLGINDAYKQFVNEGGLSKDLALKALRSSGYTTSEFKAGGYSAKETKSAGFSINDALNAKYSRSQVADAYGKAALGKLDTGKSSLNGIGYAGKKINHKDYISANGLSTSTISGNAVYQRVYDPVTQKAIGKTKKITFDMFNPTFVRENPQIAGEELNYQLITHKPGQKLHKNWKALVNASTKVIKPGAEITFNKNNKGTLSSNGGVYYRDNVGIRVWNPADGKVVYHDKYTDGQRAKWIKEAKKGGIGREYARFLRYKGIKYSTGGLADYTGPAWMDGTPSKPELVLNPTDTKNFLALRDILSEATKRGVFNHEESAVGGDLNLDININVDKIDSDYDVDQIADRVKKIIVKEARSRNVTVTGRLR